MTKDHQENPELSASQWDGAVGETWLRFNHALDQRLEGFGAAAIERLALEPGHDVLEIGCGGGATTQRLAQLVGARGKVTAIDVSGPLLGCARQREFEHQNVAFIHDDAANAVAAWSDAPRFDRVFSRFGVMFFEDPQAAFAKIAAACRPGATLSFVCWQSPAQNLWLSGFVSVLEGIVELPPPPPAQTPGPFQLADDGYIRQMLAAANWRDVEILSKADAYRVVVDNDIDEALELVCNVGPVGRAIKEIELEQQALVRTRLRQRLEALCEQDGCLPAATWLVRATRS